MVTKQQVKNDQEKENNFKFIQNNFLEIKVISIKQDFSEKPPVIMTIT